MRIILVLIAIMFLSGCAVDRLGIITLSSYRGNDFTFNDNKNSTLVLLFPSKTEGLEELSNYRGIYGAFANNIHSSWRFPLKNMNYIADYDSNIDKYKNTKDYYIVKIESGLYKTTTDRFNCIYLLTTISAYPHTSNSSYIYKAVTCSLTTDIRIVAENVYSELNSYWYEEKYGNEIIDKSTSTMIADVKSDRKIDMLLGYKN